jgi:uncharacterized membrane protein YgdD (TMEM256/DUF423 family)
MLTQKSALMCAAISGLLAVALGAFGAHALKELLLANDRQDTYDLATRYHFYHTLAILGVGILMDKLPGKTAQLSATLMLLGMILFSGSLYVLALTDITRFAIVTPIGGVCMIGGWALLIVTVAKLKTQE